MKREPDIQQLDEMPGANMDTRAVHSHLKKQGWKLTRTSGSHDVYTHPDSEHHIPVPRHKKLKAPLVLSILRTSKMTNKPRNEEVEQIDEVSTAMLARYVKTAARDTAARGERIGAAKATDPNARVTGTTPAIKAADDKNLKRQRYIQKATEKIALRAMAKEEVELEEGSGPKEKQKTPYRDINSPEYKSAAKEHKAKMDSEEKASKGKELLKRFMKKEEVEIDEARLAMPLKGHAYHYKSDAELKYIQKDAHEAAQAMKGHSPKAEAKYLDQHNDASTVLHYRSKGGQQLQKEETAWQKIQRLRDKREDEAREREERGMALDHKPKEKKQPSRQVVQGHRYGGSKQKDDVNEEIEQIDELKKTTLLSYIGKATQRIGDRAAQSTLDYRRGEKEKGRESQRKEMKHATGVVRAAGRLATGRTTNEEVEQIDEISAQTHYNYQKAARREIPALASHATSGEYKDMAQKILDKRIKGMTRSSALQLRNKMAAKNEEVELDEAVEVRTDQYKWSHGKNPSGRGNWIFSPHKSLEGKESGKHYYETNATYGEAKKQAQKWAQEKGHRSIRVHEDVEIDEQHREKGRFHPTVPYNVQQTKPQKGYLSMQKEEVESIGAHADKLKKYADEHGGIDKNSFHTAANLMKKGDHAELRKHVRSMDTDPRDKVLDHIHPHHWKSLGFSPTGSMERAVKAHNKMHGINEAKDDREYDYEGDMSKTQLKTIIRNAQKIHDMIEDDENMPEWVQSKITLAKDYLVVSANYLESVMNEEYLEEKNAPTNPELWARAKSLAKSKFDVYPSAYANGWASKWYKEKGGGWKSVSEEVEQIDELSKDTLNSYRDKVHGSIAKKYNAGDYEGVSKRLQGLAKSGMKLAGVKMKKEEVEQIDELSKDTLRSYAAKAIDSTRTMPGTGSKDESSKKSKRMSSVMLAAKKLNKEEVELDEEKKPYVAVHAKHGKHETHGSTSYEAAQNAAKHWKMKNTAGIDVYRADKTHSTQHVGEEVEQIDEVHAPGTKVKVPHNGKMVSGKVVRHDKGQPHGSPFYVVDVGEYESKTVPAHKVQKEETEPPFTPSKPKKDVVVGKKGEGVAKARHLARMAMNKQKEKLNKVTMKNESLEESRKTEVVKELAKKKKEKFEADPVVSDTVVKSDMPQP
jgi:predicted RNA binding protein YcfA (HicA-like mRNA interferase family)